jgi:3-dehydroquinate dehydratase-2
MAKPIFILNGPNLNLLGRREPEIYGRATLDDIQALAAARAETLGHAIVFRQTNHEGLLIDWLQEAGREAAAVVLNPGGLTHTSIALHDAVKACEAPVIEVHLSNPAAREAFRHHSYVAPVAAGSITGFGVLGYVLAVEAAASRAAARPPS